MLRVVKTLVQALLDFKLSTEKSAQLPGLGSLGLACAPEKLESAPEVVDMGSLNLACDPEKLESASKVVALESLDLVWPLAKWSSSKVVDRDMELGQGGGGGYDCQVPVEGTVILLLLCVWNSFHAATELLLPYLPQVFAEMAPNEAYPKYPF
ncbi:hypothetical protein STEG23_027587 [Scotinomys teguina]